jgi:PPM family protein phosphatase
VGIGGGNTRTGRHDAFEYAVAIEHCTEAGQDRATVVHSLHGLIIALADGAGGTSNGAQAADAVIKAVQESPALDPAILLYELDDPNRLGNGETTAVILSVSSEIVAGASVGDSGAWLIAADGVVDLTRAQHRKPLVGGGCTPFAFTNALPPGSTVLIASDGLFRYAKPSEMARAARKTTLDRAATALIDLARLPSGGLQDDISIVQPSVQVVEPCAAGRIFRVRTYLARHGPEEDLKRRLSIVSGDGRALLAEELLPLLDLVREKRDRVLPSRVALVLVRYAVRSSTKFRRDHVPFPKVRHTSGRILEHVRYREDGFDERASNGLEPLGELVLVAVVERVDLAHVVGQHHHVREPAIPTWPSLSPARRDEVGG